MQLYYYEGSERKGPVTSVRLREMAQNGEIRPDTILETPSGIQSEASEIGSFVTGLSLEKEFGSNALPDPAPIKLDAELIDLTSSPELDLDANSTDLTSSPALELDADSTDLTSSPALDLNADENALDSAPYSELTVESAFDAKPYEYVPYPVEAMKVTEPQITDSAPEQRSKDPLQSLNEELLRETQAADPLASTYNLSPPAASSAPCSPNLQQTQTGQPQLSVPDPAFEKNKGNRSLGGLLAAITLAVLTIIFVVCGQNSLAFLCLTTIVVVWTFRLGVKMQPAGKTPAPAAGQSGSGNSSWGCSATALVFAAVFLLFFLDGFDSQAVVASLAIIAYCLYEVKNVLKA
jgi:hypothetical protein